LASNSLIEEFTERINKHQGIIYKISKMYCDDVECRKDLFQEILLQLWRSYPRYSGKSKFSSWMYRVALNTAISQFRSSQNEIISFNAELPSEINEEISEKEENTKILYKAIGKLNKAEKSLIILYLDNLQYNEIAEITGISMSNVGVKINRIKAKLQKILKELGYEL
jgi:RNA polymerase sigma-70 factor (ECF subfamily)